MANTGPSVRAPKRRRTVGKPPRMVEGEDSSIDTFMHTTVQDGPDTRRVLVPVRLDEPQRKGNYPEQSLPDPGPDHHNYLPPDVDQDNSIPRPRTKDRWYYMKEFVCRVDGILEAMHDREGLPDPSICPECGESVGQWRCQDCIGCTLLCRKCMRHSHFSNPFHRIECWTGTHFRPAALWEVGVYLMLAHRNAPYVCANLSWQKRILEDLQNSKDRQYVPNVLSEQPLPNATIRPDGLADPQFDRESGNDAAAMRLLDQLLAGDDRNEMVEEDDEDEVHDTEADVQDAETGTQGFEDYMQPGDAWTGLNTLWANTQTPDTPSRDGLNNQYVRVVHTNGIHHISLVGCTCRTHDEIITDLIYAQMVPTSFSRIRTLFTTFVLDRFRSCNLEMKSSAYQFYQMLRRITNPMNPFRVTNLYHELRRLSRLWRWVKKLRWAGYGQKTGQHSEPEPGGLANFCPACPQIGINVADTWSDDPNRWVFRRVMTADGNFKADHVRQKTPADDIWLYDGLGMTARRREYSSFLEHAAERKTVGNIYLVHKSGLANSYYRKPRVKLPSVL